MFASSRNHDTASISRLLQRMNQKSNTQLASPASSLSAADARQTDGYHAKTNNCPAAIDCSSSASRHSQCTPQRSPELATTPGPTLPRLQHWCSACWTDLDDQMLQHQCLKCPDFRLCQACFTEAPTRHPGHDFEDLQLYAKGGPPGVSQRYDRLASGGGADEPVGADGRGADERSLSGGVASDDAASAFWVPSCGLCAAKLYELRYECQECADLNFCWRGRCRRSHAHHALRAITCVERDTEVEDSPSAGVGSAHDQIHQDASSAGDTDDSDAGTAEDVEEAENADGVDSTDLDDDFELQDTDTSHDAYSEGNIVTAPLTVSSFDFLATTKALDEAIGRLETKTLAITQSLANMRALLRAVERAHHVRVPDVPGRRTRESPVNLGRSLPVEIATLSRHDDESDDDDISQSHVRGKQRAQRNNTRPLRPWSRSQRAKLDRLKDKGWSNERIGKVLNRSSGAISQQWRKQKKV